MPSLPEKGRISRRVSVRLSFLVGWAPTVPTVELSGVPTVLRPGGHRWMPSLQEKVRDYIGGHQWMPSLPKKRRDFLGGHW